MGYQVTVQIPTYQEVLGLSVVTEMKGPDAELFIETLEPGSFDVSTVTRPGVVPAWVRVRVFPFKSMTEEKYADWVRNFLREKLAERWSCRW